MTDCTPDLSSRRSFLKHLGVAGAATIVGTTTDLFTRPMTAWAVPGAGNDTVVVNVFLRGGADGLNIVVPYADPEYLQRRPTIGLRSGDYTDLDGFFGLNDLFAPLYPHFQDGRLAIVQAVGTPTETLTRSHFQAQPQVDTGMSALGWLQRSLQAGATQGEAFDQTYAGLTIGGRVSPPLQGPWSGTVVKTIRDTTVSGMSLAITRPALEAMYATAQFPLERSTLTNAFLSIDQVSMVMPGDSGAYPSGGLAVSFREAAALIKADVGVRGVALDYGGWDTHSSQADRFDTLGPTLSQALDAFQNDLGAASTRVVVVVMTEFGRTAEENGPAGTDHGHGNFMMVMGDSLVGAGGGRVHLRGDWPGLAIDQLHAQRELAITTDFRTVLAEIVDRHLGVAADAVFDGPGASYLGLFESSLLGDTDQSGSVDQADAALLLDDLADNPTPGYFPGAADLDQDGDVDLRDALLLAQQIDR